MLTNNLLIRVPALLIALTFHELAHGWVAWRLGDPTAKDRGRLTLNPLAHIDPVGLLALWLVGFGWAKPVPVNPMYFKGDRHRGMFLVGLAGPVTNFILAFFFILLLFAIPGIREIPYLADVMVTTFQYNVFLGVFNLLPIPPLDGSKVFAYFLPPQSRYKFSQLEQYGPLILMLLIFLPFGFLQRIVYPMAEFAINSLITITALLTGGF